MTKRNPIAVHCPSRKVFESFISMLTFPITSRADYSYVNEVQHVSGMRFREVITLGQPSEFRSPGEYAHIQQLLRICMGRSEEYQQLRIEQRLEASEKRNEKLRETVLKLNAKAKLSSGFALIRVSFDYHRFEDFQGVFPTMEAVQAFTSSSRYCDYPIIEDAKPQGREEDDGFDAHWWAVPFDFNEPEPDNA